MEERRRTTTTKTATACLLGNSILHINKMLPGDA